MGRLQQYCGGDCDKCELRITGQVDMIPCVLDQLFRRVQMMEKTIAELSFSVSQVINNAQSKDVILTETPYFSSDDNSIDEKPADLSEVEETQN